MAVDDAAPNGEENGFCLAFSGSGLAPRPKPEPEPKIPAADVAANETNADTTS